MAMKYIENPNVPERKKDPELEGWLRERLCQGPEKEPPQVSEKDAEVREALQDFVIRVARNEDGKCTEAEIQALPQIVALLTKWPFEI